MNNGIMSVLNEENIQSDFWDYLSNKHRSRALKKQETVKFFDFQADVVKDLSQGGEPTSNSGVVLDIAVMDRKILYLVSSREAGKLCALVSIEDWCKMVQDISSVSYDGIQELFKKLLESKVEYFSVRTQKFGGKQGLPFQFALKRVWGVTGRAKKVF